MSPSSAALKIAPTYPSHADDPPPTARWGRADLELALASFRAITDDEPTVEAPAPRIPPGVRSPLGEDDEEVLSNEDILSTMDAGDGVPWGIAGTWAAAVSIAVASAFVATTSEPTPIDNTPETSALAAVPVLQR